MAGASNAHLKRLGFRGREVTKIRAKYGSISSPKDAANAAGMAGVRVPPKLQSLTSSRLATPAAISLKTRAAEMVAKRIEGSNTSLQMGAKLGRKEGALAKKLSDRQVQIMSIAQREMGNWRKTGTWDRSALKPHEWAEAGKLLERV